MMIKVIMHEITDDTAPRYTINFEKCMQVTKVPQERVGRKERVVTKEYLRIVQPLVSKDIAVIKIKCKKGHIIFSLVQR